MILKKAFTNQREAIQSIQTLPADVVLQAIGLSVMPSMHEATLPLVLALEPIDRALFLINMACSFHAGYADCMADAEKGKNLHDEFSAAAQPQQ